MTAEPIDELLSCVPSFDTSRGRGPGLTSYRFRGPSAPRRENLDGPSLDIVAQGRKAVTTVDGRRYAYGPFESLVVGGRVSVRTEVLEASPGAPCAGVVVQLDPVMLRSTSADMLGRRRADQPAERPDTCIISALDGELITVVLRLLRSQSDEADRRVLTPLYLRELTYRILQRDNPARVLLFAATQTVGTAVDAAIEHLCTHLAEPLTVATLARQVNLSPSAFTRVFRDATGSSPYQYLKQARLNRARELLLEARLNVADVGRAVGYCSTSHFIKEFSKGFGATPGQVASLGLSSSTRLSTSSGRTCPTTRSW